MYTWYTGMVFFSDTESFCQRIFRAGRRGMGERHQYFEEALSDFMHDAASGGAIRHLVDLGYSVEQMISALSYPTPRERVRKTAYRYMVETGLLLQKLPGEEDLRTVIFGNSDMEKAKEYLYKKIKENGEENCYFSCPFGMWRCGGGGELPEEKALGDRLSCLNKREQEYIEGILWEDRLMYHRLNGRMKEIGMKLFLKGTPDCGYYFLKTGEAAQRAVER